MEIENTVCIFPFENFQPLLVGVIFNQLKFYKVNNGFFKNSNHLCSCVIFIIEYDANRLVSLSEITSSRTESEL